MPTAPTAVDSVGTIADLKAAPIPVDNTTMLVEGFATRGDGGDGQFQWRSAAGGADDGATLIVSSNSSTGRWVRLIPGISLSVKAFGAKGDGARGNDVMSDTIAFKNALIWQKASGGEIYIPAGIYNITSSLEYITTGQVGGLKIQGADINKVRLLYSFTGASFLKIRGTQRSKFMQGGYLRDFTISPPNPDTSPDFAPPYPYFSQQAAIDIGNWVQFEIARVSIVSVHGHGIWAPMQFDLASKDFANDKPWVYVDKRVPTGRVAQLMARVAPSQGNIPSFRVLRPGSGYQAGDTVRVVGGPGNGNGPGQGFAGTVVTESATTGVLTSGQRDILNVASLTDVAVGQTISGNGIPAGATVTAVTVVNSVNVVTMSVPATSSSATTTMLTFAWPDGGIMRVNVSNQGQGYYEANDHIGSENPDDFTTGLASIHDCFFNNLDGIAIVLSHFASSGFRIVSNTIGQCRQGGIFNGGNNNHIEGNAIGANGMHPTAGYFPGLWLCRVYSAPNNTIVTTTEFDSNALCHILVDGATSPKVYDNRFNSWVTTFTTQTDWKKQIPAEHIKFSLGNTTCINASWDINRNAHRSQPVGGSVPASVCTVTRGSAVVTARDAVTPLASGKFIVGAKVEVLAGGHAIVFGSGLETTTIARIAQQITGALTSGSSVIAGVPLTDNIAVGDPISGVGIPVGATVTAVDDFRHEITISAAATVTGAYVALTTVGTVTAGDLAKDNKIIRNVAVAPAMAVGNPISGPGIPVGARIADIDATLGTIAMTVPAKAAGTQVPLAVACTMVLADTCQFGGDTATIEAVIDAIIEDEHVTWIDLGRDTQSTVGWVVDPVDNTNSKSFTRVANWRSGPGAGAQISYTDGTWRKIGNPGLGAALVRIPAASPSRQITIPSYLSLPAPTAPQPTLLVVPWSTAWDPETRMDGSGRFFTLGSGIFEASGAVAITGAAAGDLFVIQLYQDNDALAPSGSLSTVSGVARELRYQAKGLALETIPFSFSTNVTALNTWVGTNLPIQNPAVGEAGLIAWNPATKTSQRWSSVVWETVGGTTPISYKAPFDHKSVLKIGIFAVRPVSTVPLTLDDSTSRFNWCSFKQIG